MDGNFPEDDEEFDLQLELLGEKDPLVQMLDQSKEFFEREISAKESLITKAIFTEQKETEETISREQHRRNRGIIKEIISTIATFKSEIKQDFDSYRGDEDD